MNLHLVNRGVDGVGLGGRVEECRALSSEAFENRVVIGGKRQRLYANDLAADHHVIAGL